MKNILFFRRVAYLGIAFFSTSALITSAADGLFGTYFERMTGPCSSGYVITGFSDTSGSFGTKSCTSLLALIGNLYGSQSAPAGEAMLGFNAAGNPVFGSVNWSRVGSNIGFVGGRVGVGTTAPTALLDITGGDATINNLTVGRGGGNVLSNVAIGYIALQSNTSGYSNLGAGYGALAANTSGYANIGVGQGAMIGNTTGFNNTVVGINAMNAVNHTGFMNVAVGQNTLQPNISGYQNVAIGVNALLSNTTGVRNTVVGMGAGTNITAGTDNVAIGAGAIVPGGVTSNVIVIGAGAYLPNMNSNQIRMGNTNISYAGIQVPWTITSDRSLKMDIHATPLGLEFIRELRPVGYARKNDVNHSVEFGFIAQDIEALLEKNELKNSGMVSTDNLGIKSVRYNDFFAPVVRSIQEVDMSVAVLSKTIEDQNREINLLKSRLEALEGKTIQ